MRGGTSQACTRLGLLLTLATFALAGCSLGGRAPDKSKRIPSGSAVPQPPADVLNIPDAVPRAEPRATRGNPPFYEVFGKRYHVLATAEGHVERGTASWYGPGFHSASTSMGEPYDMYAMTAAHKTLPLPAYAEVTNLRNGRRVVVRINDRGPFVGDRIIDLSYTAAAKLDMLLQGTAPVEMRVITPPRGATASARPPLDSPGTSGRSVSPQPQAPSPPVTVVNAPATHSAGGAVMYIQAGVFADHENARRRVEVLLAGGVELASLEEIPGERVLQRVRVGPLASVEEFDLQMQRLRDLGITDARLMQ